MSASSYGNRVNNATTDVGEKIEVPKGDTVLQCRNNLILYRVQDRKEMAAVVMRNLYIIGKVKQRVLRA